MRVRTLNYITIPTKKVLCPHLWRVEVSLSTEATGIASTDSFWLNQNNQWPLADCMTCKEASDFQELMARPLPSDQKSVNKNI